MDEDKIIELVERCIKKAANDFLAGRPVDHHALHVLHDSVRVLHNVRRIKEDRGDGYDWTSH